MPDDLEAAARVLEQRVVRQAVAAAPPAERCLPKLVAEPTAPKEVVASRV